MSTMSTGTPPTSGPNSGFRKWIFSPLTLCVGVIFALTVLFSLAFGLERSWPTLLTQLLLLASGVWTLVHLLSPAVTRLGQALGLGVMVIAFLLPLTCFFGAKMPYKPSDPIPTEKLPEPVNDKERILDILEDPSRLPMPSEEGLEIISEYGARNLHNLVLWQYTLVALAYALSDAAAVVVPIATLLPRIQSRARFSVAVLSLFLGGGVIAAKYAAGWTALDAKTKGLEAISQFLAWLFSLPLLNDNAAARTLLLVRSGVRLSEEQLGQLLGVSIWEAVLVVNGVVVLGLDWFVAPRLASGKSIPPWATRVLAGVLSGISMLALVFLLRRLIFVAYFWPVTLRWTA